MKKYILTAALAAMTLSGLANGKFDATSLGALDILRNQTPGAIAIENSLFHQAVNLTPQSRGEATVTVMVKLAEGATADDIEAFVEEVTGVYGPTAVVQATLAQIEDLENCDAVAAMQMPRVHRPMLDKARNAVGVNDIHNGTGDMSAAFDGTGVLAGIFDAGFDLNHPNFLTEDGTIRTKRFFSYTSNNGRCMEYRDAALIGMYKSDNAYEFHGTHTLGCMAGSFNGAGKMAETNLAGTRVKDVEKLPYYGMARNSDLLVAAGMLTDPNILDGVQRMVKYANEQNLPLVVNLSIGIAYGPHDGTDPFCSAITELGKKAIICLSSGNDGDLRNSIIHRFDSDCTPLKTLLGTSETGSNKTNQGILDIWCEDGSEITVTPIVFDTASGKVLFQYSVSSHDMEPTYIASDSYSFEGYVHDPNFNNYFSNSYLQIVPSTNQGTNKRSQVNIVYQLHTNTMGNLRGNVKIGFVIEGPAGKRVDVVNSNYEGVNYLASDGWVDFTEGSGEFSLSDMACGENTIIVGAWNTRKTWGALNKGSFGYNEPGMDLNDVGGYSSYGTLIDGRELPTVCAPGTGIASSVNSYYSDMYVPVYGEEYCAKTEYKGRTYYWDVQQGTSMSSPVLAGCIALWLQADPTLTVDRAKEIILATAIKDKYVQKGNPVQWGAGKFDALAGMKMVLAGSGVGSIVTDSPSGLIMSSKGKNVWDLFVAGNATTKAEVFDTAGRKVRHISANGDSATMDLSDMPHGIYVVRVNGTYSRRVVVL